MAEHISKYRPGKDKYSSARILENLPLLYGEKGKFIVGLYEYCRWVDDTVDEHLLDHEEKKAFMQKQLSLITGQTTEIETLNEHEVKFTKLSWSSVPEKEIKQQIKIMFNAIDEDIENSHFSPLSERKIRHHNWRLLIPCLRGLSFAINGKDIKITDDFAVLTDYLCRLASLADFEEDIDRGLINLPTTKIQAEQISNTPDDKKRETVLKVLNKEAFKGQKTEILESITQSVSSILDLNLPWWQKLFCICYLEGMTLRKNFTVQYPKFDMI